MKNELDELKDWMKKNAAHFRQGTYAPDEIAYLAHLGGFSWETIHKVIPEAYLDITQRSTAKLREDYHIGREIRHINERKGPNMNEQWHRLYNYENGQDWL